MTDRRFGIIIILLGVALFIIGLVWTSQPKLPPDLGTGVVLYDPSQDSRMMWVFVFLMLDALFVICPGIFMLIWSDKWDEDE